MWVPILSQSEKGFAKSRKRHTDRGLVTKGGLSDESRLSTIALSVVGEVALSSQPMCQDVGFAEKESCLGLR